jgi:uncharacterized membrane protein YbaN (DUF454 family)
VRLPALPIALRGALFVVGWALLLVGVLGLVLPGLQGCLTIALAAALLSLVSEGAYRALRRAFVGWPRGWRRVVRLRGWLERKLTRKGSSDGGA